MPCLSHFPVAILQSQIGFAIVMSLQPLLSNDRYSWKYTIMKKAANVEYAGDWDAAIDVVIVITDDKEGGSSPQAPY